MSTKIIIGRDASTRQLRLSANSQSKVYGQPSSVPMNVSRQHCSVDVDDNGNYTITNLNPQNTTYVNGLAVESKVIKPTDIIDLGADHYRLDWSAIKAMVQLSADIRPLKQIWQEYDDAKTRLTIRQGQFNALRSATGIITMVAILLTILTGQRGGLYIVLYVTAILLSGVFFIVAYRNAAKIPLQKKELDNKFQQDYRCPQCHRFLGFQSYDLISQNDFCPYCKAKFKK